MFIPLFKPLIEAEELAAAEAALKLGWLGQGSYVRQLESTLEAMIGGTKRAVAVSTGHAALHLGLMRMGLGPGDEVLTPSFNNAADMQAIRAVGAEPVFCDIDPHSLCLDPAAAEALIGPRTRAIIVTDYSCAVADHAAVRDIAARHGLRVLHDAAHSFGGRQDGRPIGGVSDMTMFSFDAIKIVTAIDGGILMVDPDDVESLREARLIGMGQASELLYANRRALSYDIVGLGFRYHMANLHAALALTQIAKLDRIAAGRRGVLATYREAFAGLDLRLPPDEPDVIPLLAYARVDPSHRADFCAHLSAREIENGRHWQPAHEFTFFQGARQGPLPVTERVAAEIVTLPLHPAMAPEALERVIDAVVSFFRG